MERTPHMLAHCELHGLTILCGRCGHHTCSPSYGEEGKCPDCPSAHELMQSLGNQPILFAAVTAKRKDIKAWKTTQLQSLFEAAGASDPQWLLNEVTELTDRAHDALVELERALRLEANQVL